MNPKNKISTFSLLMIFSIGLFYYIDENYSIHSRETFFENAFALNDTQTTTISFGVLNAGTVIINPQTELVYLSNYKNGTITVLDGNSDELLNIFEIKSPFGLGINQKTNTLYVASEFTDTLYVVSGDTNQIKDSINVEKPYDIAVNENTNMIYVTNDRSGLVYVIDGNTNEIVRTFEVAEPCGISLNSETNMVYVTSESTDKVHVIDGNTNEFVKTIDVSKSPRGVIVNPKTNLIYVTNQESNTVSVIDGSTNSVIDSIDVGMNPKRVIVNPKTNLIYVTNQESNTVSVIDGSTNSVIDSVSISSPFEIAINSDSNKIYTTYYGTGDLTIFQGFESNQHEIITSSDNLPPVKQIKSGISPNDITCNVGRELILKIIDNSPACVKPDSIPKLIERGWATNDPAREK